MFPMVCYLLQRAVHRDTAWYYMPLFKQKRELVRGFHNFIAMPRTQFWRHAFEPSDTLGQIACPT